MKKLFFFGSFFLLLFEFANVYFLTPLPGSQEMEGLDIAYFLYTGRWIFRGLFGVLIVSGWRSSWTYSKWLTGLIILIIAAVEYMVHFKMAADTMFYKPENLHFVHLDQNKVAIDRLVLGIEYQGQAKAYPIQYIYYHHQIPDSIGEIPILVTYCGICRSGRVYKPLVNGQKLHFRLVGMDHYNSMFEDDYSKSWWRQVTGEAVAGPLKGQQLPEFPSFQTSLDTWLRIHPNSLIMQPDTNFTDSYADAADYESGRREGRLTRYDTASWHDNSWIAGIAIGGSSKAYDWNELTKHQVINDVVNTHPVSILITKDQKSLFAFLRQSPTQILQWRNDTLTDGTTDYTLSGHAMDASAADLQWLQVYQEYWYSWRTFHPATER